MEELLRVSRDFMSAPANDVANLGDDVVDGFTGSAVFTAPPVTVAQMIILVATLRTSVTASDSGGPVDTAAKNKALKALRNALRKNANYVEIMSDNDEETMLSSGFDIVSTNRAQAPLDSPLIVGLTNLGTTLLLLRMLSVLNAKSYQVQIATAAAGPWSEAGIFTQARRITLAGLIPGTTYFVRVRAVGGSTGYSEWVISTPIMAT